MGREVECLCRCGGESGAVKALLESSEIILRGAIKRRLPLIGLADVKAEGEALRFASGPERYVLAMGAREAAAWAKKIAAPPPTLRAKLGLDGPAKALLVGAVDDVALEAALRGATTRDAATATMVVAVARDAKALAAALEAHGKLAAGGAIWIVHEKGRGAAFGETQVRAAMRAAGFIDTKVAAVSATLTASRYAKRATP